MQDFESGKDDFNGKMRLYRFWKTMPFDVIIDGRSERINCTAGSNISLADAAGRCAAQAEKIQKIIAGREKRDWNYERPIREEIVREIDADNIITRNYYGALVLNTTSISIFDIDQYQKTFWETITFKKIDNKTGIVNQLRALHSSGILPGSTWRIYETCKGIRLIVLGQYIEPSSPLFADFSKKINSDSLYAFMCLRQNCYRARLTPKPHRMKIRCMKYRCPIPEGMERQYAEWVDEYERESHDFGVCRLVDVLGARNIENAMVDLHDRYCCNDGADRLA